MKEARQEQEFLSPSPPEAVALPAPGLAQPVAPGGSSTPGMAPVVV